jgi:hypothetical protein
LGKLTANIEKMKRILIILFLSLLLVCAGPLKTFARITSFSDGPNELIFLQADRDIYVAGENLFFTVELVNYPTTAETLSEIAYLALRSKHGVIERISFNMDQNRFSGSLYLPDTLSTGYLELICFTNWMRNFDEGFYFKKTILVVNRFDKGLNFIEESNLVENQTELKIYPESGHLVSGISQKLLITTWPETPLPFGEIIILSESGDSIHQVTLNETGWTTLDFFPEPGKSYYARIRGIEKNFVFPQPEFSNHLMQISQKGKSILIKITINHLINETLSIVVSRKGKSLMEFLLTISGLEPYIMEIPVAGLENGAYEFNLIAQDGSVRAKRNWFLDQRAMARLSVSFNQPAFRNREKVEMVVQLEDSGDAIDWVNISVVNRTGMKPQNLSFHSFLLALELLEDVKISPQEAFRLLGGLSHEEINDLFIMPLFPEENLAIKSGEAKRYYRETSHLTLTGRVTEVTNGKPVNDARIILNTPDTIVNLLYSISNGNGFFNFFLDSYYDNREVFLTPDPGTIPGEVKIEVYDKFKFITPFNPTPMMFFPGLRDAIKESQEIAEINKAFGISNTAETQESMTPAEPVRVFSEAVFSINTDDFIPLDDLQEIAREIIGPWRIRRSRSRSTHSLVSQATSNIIDGVPILFVDGIITYDIEPLLKLNSRQIKNIQILNLEWKHGDMHFPGIVAIFTRNEEYRTLDLIPKPVRVFNPAHHFPAKFISPDHSKSASPNTQPDLRQLLYWYSGRPVVQNGSALFIWHTSDLHMEYSISIEGVTKNGSVIKIETQLVNEEK